MDNSQATVQVFDDPDASDPSHSLLSKVCGHEVSSASKLILVRQDHFALILNEPAGKIALVVVQHTVKLLVQVSLRARIPSEHLTDTAVCRLGPTTATPIESLMRWVYCKSLSYGRVSTVMV